MSTSTALWLEQDWRPALSHRRRRPIEEHRGWRALWRVDWAPPRLLWCALLLALAGHALLLLLWWREVPRPPPVLAEPWRISLQLSDPLTAVVLEQPPTATSTATSEPAASLPAARVPPASRPPTLVAPVPEPTAAAADPRSSELSIDWNAAMESAVRAQLDSSGRAASGRLGKPVPALPGASSQGWAQPAHSTAQRVAGLGQSLSNAKIVGGDGLHALVAPNLTEQMIDAILVDLQSECHPTANGRLKCPPERR